MTKIYIEGHDFKYELEDVLSLFYARETFEYVKTKSEFNELLKQETLYSTSLFSDSYIICELSANEEKGHLKAMSKVFANSKMHGAIENANVDFNDKLELKKEAKRIVKLSLLKALSALTGKNISWGTLTGIRPTKRIMALYKEGIKRQDMVDVLHKRYGVQENKAKLMLEVVDHETKCLNKNKSDTVSLYLDIPFCPTRCLYCSFTSNPILKYKEMVNTYLQALAKEMQKARQIIIQNRWDLENVYIGGGTPTSLNEEQFEYLLTEINNSFQMQFVREYTIEAGRPDTITSEKLELMKKYGVSRISINPQTMNDFTLKVIGRRHTVNDIKDVYYMARDMGFNDINMDIIMGLPGENLAMFANTLQEVRNLRPDSITVHTLAIKKGSDLIEKRGEYFLEQESEIEKMQDLSYNAIEGIGLKPYYMYRQKNMIGGQENIGYCVPGKECIYNIKMIEEVQNIIALGAGAVSRLINSKEGTIEKIFNDKSVEGYIARIDEMIEKKNVFLT